MTNEVKNIPALRFSGFEGEWEEKLIKDILEFENNRRKPVTSTIREIGNYPYYGASGIIDYVKDYIFNNERRLLIGEDGAKWGSFEESSFIATGRYWVNNHAHVAKSELNNLIFLNNLLNYKELRTYVTGNAPAKLTYNNLCNIPILLPSIEEQNKIGNFFIKLDHQIELEEQKLEKLEEQKKGYMQKIFSQELRFKDENGNEYPEWEEKEINSVLEKIIDNRGKTPENNSTEIYPMLEVNSLGNYYPKYNKVAKFVSEKTYKAWFREHIKLNDVLFSTVGNTGLVSLMDNNKAVIAQNIVGLRINSENDATFLYYLLSYWENQKKVKQIQMGAVQPSVKVSQFKYLKFYFPTKDEQQEIGVFLTIFDKIFEEQSKKIEILKERKQGLLQKMFV